eukprot:m.227424 g.227424  ORF g.227424 m.227424 type:complete len:190 (-) comp11581_c0_seq1:64-633(-)
MSATKKTPASIWDLEGQIGFYAAYHNNTLNIICHVIGVPLIVWSLYVWLASIGDFAQVAGFGVNLSTIIALSYGLYFIALEKVAGTIALIEMLFLSVTATAFAQHEDAIFTATIVHFASWALQFFGHFVFEGRAPALFDSAFQSFVLAPLFVLIELLFVLGYRSDLAKTVDANAKRDIAAWKATKGKAQ